MFWWPVHLVSALIELGRLDEADAGLRSWDCRARAGVDAAPGAARLRAAGQLAAALHQLHLARQCFYEALAVPDEYVDFLERALAIEAYGRFLLRRRGERRSAIDRLRAARDRYQCLGDSPFLERCDRELAACGIHDPEATMADDPLDSAGARGGRADLLREDQSAGGPGAGAERQDDRLPPRERLRELGVHTRAQLVEAMRAHHH